VRQNQKDPRLTLGLFGMDIGGLPGLNLSMAGDVTAGYIGRNIERLREPMQRISDFIYSRAATQ